MANYSPLRYPGGKRRLIHTIKTLLEVNGLKDIHYVEPFSGGASVALTLLFEAYASVIHINDLDPAIYAFWESAVNDSERLARKIEQSKLTISEWKRQREIYRSPQNVDQIDLAYATLYLNRSNRSGILKAGVIGGLKQAGKWKLDARFNVEELAARVRQIGRFRGSIKVHGLEASQLIDDVVSQLPKGSLTFFDPPYILKGGLLYLDPLDIEGHKLLAKKIERVKRPWVVTYDYEAVRQDLFKQRRRVVYDLQYVARRRAAGREVMFLNDRLKMLPLNELCGQRMHAIPSLSRFR